MNILLVDDEPLIGKLLRMMLKSTGHKIEAVDNPLEAVAAYQPGRFDLIITDMSMPGIDGLTFASRIKEKNASQKIALLTGLGNVGAKDAQIDFVLQKPFNEAEFNEMLSQLESN